MSPTPYLWTTILVACTILWAAGLRLFLRSGLSRSRRLTWAALLVAVGVAMGVLLPLPGIAHRFLIVLCAVPLLGTADVFLLRSHRGFSFWLRACGFEVCTVFAVAALVRVFLDSQAVTALIRDR